MIKNNLVMKKPKKSSGKEVRGIVAANTRKKRTAKKRKKGCISKGGPRFY